ncbi:MAG: hypothetical protein U0892_01070 [Pirellulales bacterium]
MVRPKNSLWFAALLSVLPAVNAFGAEPKSAYQLLPQSAQAVVLIPDSAVIAERWQRTQLSKLAEDPAVKEFWKDQQQQIETKLTAAGWRLHIEPRDLETVVDGQVALSWIERRGNVQKPFSLALIVDVVENNQDVASFLQKLDQQLIGRGAKADKSKYAGSEITHYILPRQNGELLQPETCYAVVGKQLLAADDIPTLNGLIDAAKADTPAKDKLDSDPVFIAGRSEIKSKKSAQVEYFVRPIGFARVIRAISGKHASGSTDILTVLQNQGFEAIKCVAGELELGSKEYDVVHRGFVLADGDRPTSVQVLDFPNDVKRVVPNWVAEGVSTFLIAEWNAKDAFWKVEKIVDEMAGQEGVFKEIINGIANDPTGPQIDIRKEIMPLLTNDIYAVSDVVVPVDINSRRNLIAIRVNDPAAMNHILDKAMKKEPEASEVTVDGKRMWKVEHKEEEEIDVGDFGGFGAAPAAPAQQNDPLLKSWAITVHDEYLMFASHPEMIAAAIAQAEADKKSPLSATQDYRRVDDALKQVFGSENVCVFHLNRSEKSYRSQYDLFRQGKLNSSESMFAKILEHLVQNKSELKKPAPVVDGGKLPPYETISHYLQPSGLVVSTAPNGWSFGSLLLAPDAAGNAAANVGANEARAAAESAATNR